MCTTEIYDAMGTGNAKTKEMVYNRGDKKGDGSAVGSAVSSYAKTINNSVATQAGGSPRAPKKDGMYS